MAIRFPNESDEYRAARDELLQAEIALRAQIASVAAMRQKLPLGGAIEDYVFEEVSDGAVSETCLSDLFAQDKNTLILYSYMYGPDNENPCPMCTGILDGLNGQAHHLSQRVNVAVVGKSPAPRLQTLADGRDWKHLRLLSSEKNGYHDDYFGQTPDGVQMPMCNVFQKTSDGVRHFYGSELLYAGLDGDPRHMDLMFPLWNFLDLTPEGRGTNWYPSLSYD
jgi:predicted dithiol-disulfide oxidoreductase (DUF899 family)